MCSFPFLFSKTRFCFVFLFKSRSMRFVIFSTVLFLHGLNSVRSLLQVCVSKIGFRGASQFCVVSGRKRPRRGGVKVTRRGALKDSAPYPQGQDSRKKKYEMFFVIVSAFWWIKHVFVPIFVPQNSFLFCFLVRNSFYAFCSFFESLCYSWFKLASFFALSLCI